MTSANRMAAAEQAALLLGRVLIATLFLHEAVAKIHNYANATAYMRRAGLPDALLPAALALELGCGLALVLGVWTRTSALLLAGFCIATAVVFHADFSVQNQLLHFEKNLAVAGGLLVLAVTGPGLVALRSKAASVPRLIAEE